MLRVCKSLVVSRRREVNLDLTFDRKIISRISTYFLVTFDIWMTGRCYHRTAKSSQYRPSLKNKSCVATQRGGHADVDVYICIFITLEIFNVRALKPTINFNIACVTLSLYISLKRGPISSLTSYGQWVQYVQNFLIGKIWNSKEYLNSWREFVTSNTGICFSCCRFTFVLILLIINNFHCFCKLTAMLFSQRCVYEKKWSALKFLSFKVQRVKMKDPHSSWEVHFIWASNCVFCFD